MEHGLLASGGQLLLACMVLGGVPLTSEGMTPSVYLPVLIVPTEPPDPCKCEPSVVPLFEFGGGSQCGINPVQPCFSVSIEGSPEEGAGKCVAPSDPPLVQCSSKSSCIFKLRTVKITASVCAGTGGCGTPPYQAFNASGDAVDGKFGALGYAFVEVPIGNRECDSIKQYTIKVLDSNLAEVVRYSLTAYCGQCPRLCG